MKPFRWSAPALNNLADREIPRDEAENALADPELVVAGPVPRRIFMRRYFDSRLGHEMLVRVLVEEREEERLVITVYISSKIDKYMKGAAP